MPQTLMDRIRALQSYDQDLSRPLTMVEAKDGAGNWLGRQEVIDTCAQEARDRDAFVDWVLLHKASVLATMTQREIREFTDLLGRLRGLGTPPES